MLALRVEAAHGRDADARASLRAFANAWPGALRELDSLTTEEIRARARACDRGRDEPWMAWMARYHELMRAALAIRRGEPAGEGLDDTFAREVLRPRHGRLNVVVFARLADETGQPARALWDALFPRRGKASRSYRD
jgi:hypothetical protein